MCMHRWNTWTIFVGMYFIKSHKTNIIKSNDFTSTRYVLYRADSFLSRLTFHFDIIAVAGSRVVSHQLRVHDGLYILTLEMTRGGHFYLLGFSNFLWNQVEYFRKPCDVLIVKPFLGIDPTQRYGENTKSPTKDII